MVIKMLRGLGSCVNALELGSDLHMSNTYGVTIIGSAVFNSKWDVAKSLHEWGCDINHVTAAGETPLMTAVCNLAASVVEFILRELHADVNFAGKDGWTPLMCAVSTDSGGIVDIIRCLLENGADVCLCNEQGMSAMSLLHQLMLTSI